VLFCIEHKILPGDGGLLNQDPAWIDRIKVFEEVKAKHAAKKGA
jgi:hypothetical protein